MGGAVVFNIQRFSIQDGPGIRTTVFFKGCPLGCLWCSNPESQSPVPQVVHRDSLCNGCGDCLKTCEMKAISVVVRDGAFGVRIDREKCNNCGKCIDVCQDGALKFYGQYMSVTDICEEARRDAAFYSNSGGGVTASGGEPLRQPEAVARFFRYTREAGIHTTLDTSGYASVPALEKVLAQTDLVLYDLKLMDRHRHKQFTEKYNNVILSNARLVVARGVQMFIRIPLIPGINDSAENLTETARFVSELDNKLHVDLLPYHRMGQGKYAMLDTEYHLKDARPQSEEQVQESLGIFKKQGLDCAIQK